MVRVFSLLVVLFVSACSKGTPAQASTDTSAQGTPAQAVAGQAAQPEPAKPVPAQLPDVLARVNGEDINKVEFEKAVKNIEGRAGGPVPADQRDRIYRDLLDQLVGYRLLTQEAKNRQVPVADADIDQRFNAIRQQFPSEEAFNELLKQQSLTAEQIRSDARQDIAIGKLIEGEISAKVAPKPDDVAAFYKDNPQNFQTQESVKARHILVGFPQGADEATKAKAREKAAGVLKEVKAGKDFAALAKEFSDDSGSAQNGGDLGLFQQGQMVGPFNDAAFSLQPGTVSDLVETEFGFHIIRVDEKQPPRTVPLEEARPKIQEFLENQNRQRETEAFVNALKAKGKVELFI